MMILPPTLGHNSRAAEIQSKAKLTIMMFIHGFMAGSSGTVGLWDCGERWKEEYISLLGSGRVGEP